MLRSSVVAAICTLLVVHVAVHVVPRDNSNCQNLGCKLAVPKEQAPMLVCQWQQLTLGLDE
jgi:hypothetical protein